MVIGDGAPAHQGRDHRDTGQFGEFHQQVAGVGIDHAATADQQRAFRLIEHGQGFFGLQPVCRWFGQWQRFIGVNVEFDFGHLHIERQIDQHRARAAGAHFVKGFLEGVRHLARLHHCG